MFQLTKQFRFEASHQLPNHDGKCARLHGHSWVGRVIVCDYELHTVGPKAGMVMDFGDLSKVLAPLVENFLDHHHLNDTLELENPTSEEIARFVYNNVKNALPLGITLIAVEIDETCTCSCRYSGPNPWVGVTPKNKILLEYEKMDDPGEAVIG